MEIATFVSCISLAVAIGGIYYALSMFKKTTTLQLEMYILDSIKIYANSEKKESDKELFLTSIDLYCKYDVNGLLSKELCEDNLGFFKDVIEEYKEDIISNPSYNNVRNYIEKYKK